MSIYQLFMKHVKAVFISKLIKRFWTIHFALHEKIQPHKDTVRLIGVLSV